MKCARWFGIFLLLLAPNLGVANDALEVKLVADGVYAVIPKGPFDGRCNSAIILLDDGVLVVDTQSTPAQAQQVIAQIKKLSDKPVKYVVNSHGHFDHWQGNQAYVETWPGVEIVASEAAREVIERRAVPGMSRGRLRLPKEIDQL